MGFYSPELALAPTLQTFERWDVRTHGFVCKCFILMGVGVGGGVEVYVEASVYQAVCEN